MVIVERNKIIETSLLRLLHLHLFQFLDLLLPEWGLFRGQVPLGVLGKMVAAHEFPLADGASVLLFTRVCTFVACQFV